MSRLFSIFCLVLGKQSPFSLEILENKTVDALKNMIKDNRGFTFHADDLLLYHVELDDDEDLVKNAMEQLERQRPLRATTELTDVFNGIPKKKTIHILVQLPDLPSAGQKHPRSSDDELDDLQPRRKYFDDKPKKAPSDRGNTSTFAREQQDHSKRILCGCPADAHNSIPVELFDEVFGHFLDNISTRKPEADDNAVAWKLANAMSSFFVDETARAKKFRAILDGYGIKLKKNFIDKYSTDGSAEVDDFFYIISEAKLEASRGGADPFLQAACYYLESVRDHKELHSELPCFLIYYYGAAIGLAGAITTGKVSCQVLTPIIPLNFHRTDSAMLDQLARILGALKMAANDLKQYYELKEFTRKQCQFPYPDHYNVLDETGIPTQTTYTFHYTRQYDEKLVFFAKDERGDSICVKFSRRYSLEAHVYAAEIGLAPRLLGFKKLAGGWFMSIMEDLGSDWRDHDKTILVSQEQAEEFSRKIETFHQGGFVHGDIRFANLLFRQQDGGNYCSIMLVDFEWSGKHGEVYYPACLTRDDRPASVVDGGLILKEHDNEVVSDLLERLT